ncbi:hypothetical protein FOLKNPGA_03424 [Legionella sp. PC1000]|nr:hypothetical protein [Legionella sp. PC1000]QLZ70610.1 hypothetical protein FOLKNPGA_03424 [Legionella sp. PC1000]
MRRKLVVNIIFEQGFIKVAWWLEQTESTLIIGTKTAPSAYNFIP